MRRTFAGLSHLAWSLKQPIAYRRSPSPATRALVRGMELDIGEHAECELSNGARVTVRLVDVEEMRDSVRGAVRRSAAVVEVNGEETRVPSSRYHLPVRVGEVRLDCPVTAGFLRRSKKANAWGLSKAARLRFWPADSPLLEPDTFTYPVRQRWFASATQMFNEPAYVDGGEIPGDRSIHYHGGLDFGGSEGAVVVLSATDGLVVSAHGDTLPRWRRHLAGRRWDDVHILDGRGWFHRYSHLARINRSVQPGENVRMGQEIGLLGKEGHSGGWSHLHYDVRCLQPSGMWGIVDAYAFAWEAYIRQHQPHVLAVARPHQLVAVGQPVELDGTGSWSRTGTITQYQWQFSDGTSARGATAVRVYDRAGHYSETLKVSDGEGATAYDFAIIQVVDPESPTILPPTLHAACHPTLNLRAGDEVCFKVRSFRTERGEESWDFGDGSPPVVTHSDGNVRVHNPEGYATTKHRYTVPGHYIVSVRCVNEHGLEAMGHLHVPVAAAR